jgi:hypothetical protein
MEIPLTVAAVGVVAVPVLAAVGAIATVVAKFDIVVERAGAARHAGSGPQTSSTVTDSTLGAKEDQMNMAGTVPQHSDNKGTKLEDLAGTGPHDSLGG